MRNLYKSIDPSTFLATSPPPPLSLPAPVPILDEPPPSTISQNFDPQELADLIMSHDNTITPAIQEAFTMDEINAAMEIINDL